MNIKNRQLGGVAIFWVGLHLMGWMMYVNGQTGPSHIVYHFVSSIWTVELYMLAIVLIFFAIILVLEMCQSVEEKPAEISKTYTNPEKIIHTDKPKEPEPRVQIPPHPPPKPTAADLKKEALKQILKQRGNE